MPDASLGGRDTHPDTVRELLTAIILREEASHAERLKRGIRTSLPGFTHRDAVAALAQLDAAERCGTGIQSSKTLGELIECRLVPDPVASSPGAPRSKAE